MLGRFFTEFLLITLILGGSRSGTMPVPSMQKEIVNLPVINDAELPRIFSYISKEYLPIIEDRNAWPKLMDERSLGVEVTAMSAIVIDKDNGKVLFEKDADTLRSIASITKLVTVLVFLDTNPDFEKMILIDDDDEIAGEGTVFDVGDELNVRDLVFATLVASANDAARALVRASGLSQEIFINRMNSRARDLGMVKTRFFDPSGIDARNVSSAREVAILFKSIRDIPMFREVTETRRYDINITRTKIKHLESTNFLLQGFLNEDPYKIIIGKTGSLPEIGFNLASSIDEGEHGVIVVALGSDNHFSRFADAKTMTYWALTKWQWKEELARTN